MWLAILLALAIIAFVIVKYMKGKGQRQQADHTRLADTSADQNSLTRGTADTSTIGIGSTGPATGAGTASTQAERQKSDAAAQSVAVSTNATTVEPVAGDTSLALDSGDTLTDVREMIKILNLAEPDASRLAISREQLRALRSADQSAAPSGQALTELAARLRKMLA